MQPVPLSVQLYSLRQESSVNYPKVLERLAKIGYKGVEPASGFYGFTCKEFRRFLDNLGLVASSSHYPWVGSETLGMVIDVAGTLGITLVGCGFGSKDFADMDSIKRTAEKVNQWVEPLKKAGLTLFQHNHEYEFTKVQERLAYDWYAELCPGVMFEIDTYWASNSGANDPAEQVRKFSKRTPLLHIKDGPLQQREAQVAVGSGKMDIPAVIQAANPAVLKWLVVELDRCDTDMFTAIEQSYAYLVGNRLAAGNV